MIQKEAEKVFQVPVRAPAGPRLPALDGLRGLAILGVLFSHSLILKSGPLPDRILTPVFFNGWIGVDLFFVLSGFLITGILWDSRESLHYFRNFYMRRVLRIFPLYYLLITVVFFVVAKIHTPLAQDMVGTAGQPIWYYLYLNNMYRGTPELSPLLGITWSLAIEEQFYFIWPTVVLLCSRRRLMQICAGLIVAALVTRVGLFMAGVYWNWIHDFILSRADALAVGAWIALALRGNEGSRLVARAAKAAVVFSIAWTVLILALKKLSLWTPGLGIALRYTPLELLFGAILVSALTATKGMHRYRFFTFRPFRTAGKLSYAMYLLHPPIVITLRDYFQLPERIPTIGGSELPRQLIFYAASISLTFLAGWISWHFFEKRFLQLKHYFPHIES
jgi:peptidoglycan/LPS O-acetylase OafA/YrhL